MAAPETEKQKIIILSDISDYEERVLIDALNKDYKNKTWQVFLEDGKPAIWWRDDSEAPTEADLKTKYAASKTNRDNTKYQRDREYPHLREQFDLLFHDMTSGKGDKTGEWYKAVKKVKDDNPKP